MLARRALSRREVSERLIRKGFASEASEREVGRLERAGLLNDEELARGVCRQELTAGRGRLAIRRRLVRRSLETPVATGALAEVTEADEQGALQRALERALRRHPGWSQDRKIRERVVRHLLGRGFAWPAVRLALEQRSLGFTGELDELITDLDEGC